VTSTWRHEWIRFGAALGVLHGVYNLVNNLAPASATLNRVLNLSIPVTLLLCGVAGYAAAKKTGSMNAGIRVGVLTGLFGMGIGIISLFLITFAFMDTIRHNAFMISDFHRSGSASMDQFIIEDALGAACVGTVASLIFGGALGALGGLIGIKAARATR
jgi:hypothetical protein